MVNKLVTKTLFGSLLVNGILSYLLTFHFFQDIHFESENIINKLLIFFCTYFKHYLSCINSSLMYVYSVVDSIWDTQLPRLNDKPYAIYVNSIKSWDSSVNSLASNGLMFHRNKVCFVDKEMILKKSFLLSSLISSHDNQYSAKCLVLIKVTEECCM